MTHTTLSLTTYTYMDLLEEYDYSIWSNVPTYVICNVWKMDPGFVVFSRHYPLAKTQQQLKFSHSVDETFSHMPINRLRDCTFFYRG